MKRLQVPWKLLQHMWGPFHWPRTRLHLSLLLLPWLIVLAVPSLRPLLIRSMAFDVVAWWQHDIANEGEAETPADVARRHPTNLALQYYSIEAGSSYTADYLSPDSETYYTETSPAAKTKKIDQLIKEFGNARWLTAWRLQVGSGLSFYDTRIAAPLEEAVPRTRRVPWGKRQTDPILRYSPSYYPPAAVYGDLGSDGSSSTSVKPRSNPPAPALPQAVRQKLETELAIAQKGRQLEPGNSYYDLHAMRYLFSLWRDDEAFAILGQTSRKQIFDNHAREQMQQSQAAQKFLGLPLPQQLLDPLSFKLDSQESTSFRHAIQLIVAKGVALEKAGQHQQALKIYEQVLHLVILMRDGSYSARDALTSCALATIVWGGSNRKISLKEVAAADATQSGQTWMRLAAQKFAAYASAHGRPDLARQTLKESKGFAFIRQKTEAPLMSVLPSWSLLRGKTYNDLNLLLILLNGLLVQGFALFCYRIVSFFFLAPGGLKSEPLKGRDTIAAVFVAALLVIPLGIGGVWRFNELILQSRSGTGKPVSDVAIMITLLMIVPAFFWPAFSGAILGAFLTVRRQEKQRTANDNSWRTRVRAKATRLSEFDKPFRAFYPASGLAAIVMGWGTVGSGLLGIFFVLYHIVAQFQSLPTRFYAPWIGKAEIGAVGCILIGISAPLGLLGWILKWRWMANPALRENAHYALSLYRRSLSWWSILIGWLFLTLALLTLAPRRQMERDIATLIERGETATLLAQK